MWLVYTHPDCLGHDNGWGHPERPARVEAVMEGARAAGVSMEVVLPRKVEHHELAAVHELRYIEQVEATCRHGGRFDLDTAAVPASWPAALLAAGSGVDAVDALEGGAGDAAFCVVRPPGHHATADRAMGFCLFNNVAVAAASVLKRGGRAAIVDWDVHHGNGTQDFVRHRPGVLMASIHQHPFYPLTGGIEDNADNIVNVPLPAGTAGDVYLEAFASIIVPRLRAFRPDWVLVSCGFDAHDDDPLAAMRLGAADYGSMVSALLELAPGRMVVMLEGGYHLAALVDSTARLLRAEPSPPAAPSPRRSWVALEEAGAAAKA